MSSVTMSGVPGNSWRNGRYGGWYHEKDTNVFLLYVRPGLGTYFDLQ